MKFYKDKKIIALGILISIFTISYFVIMFKYSYAFSPATDAENLYNFTIDTIKKAGEAYGENNKADFLQDNGNTIVIKVQDLIDAKLLVTNEQGNITNPLNSEDILNSKIVTIKKIDDKFEIKVG